MITKKMLDLPEIKVLMNMMMLANSETYYHSLAVAKYTEQILEECNQFSLRMKEEIIKGALLHDIGKIFVPLNLTQCAKPLSIQEYNIIKVHTSVSYEITKDVFSKIVQNICLYHHEKPNGSGYMNQLPLQKIPEEALLVQVADVFDALTSDRAYKRKYTQEEALSIMENDANQLLLDDTYVRILRDIILERKEEQYELSNTI